MQNALLNQKKISQQFKDFYNQHKPNNLEEAVEKFAIFGGVEWNDIDTSKDSMQLIEELILPDFRYIRDDITEITTGMPLYHSLLTGVAMGDARVQSAFKRANITKEVGDKAVAELLDIGIITSQKPKKIFSSWSENQIISNKLYFPTPFLKFWFTFVSPIFKGIRDGDYAEIRERFKNRELESTQFVFNQLAIESLKNMPSEDKIIEISSYWDKDVEIDIYAKTKSGKTIVGLSKYTNAKIKKSDLNKLKEMAQSAKIEADIFVIFAKKGFSNELKSLKGENLRLYSVKNLKNLI